MNSNPYQAPQASAAAATPAPASQLAPVRFQGQLSLADYYRAMLLRQRGWRIVFVGFAILAPVCLGIVYLQAALQPDGERYLAAMAALMWACLIRFAFLLLMPAYRWRKSAGPFVHYELVASDEKLTAQTAVASAEYRWDFFAAYRITEQVAILLVKHSRNYMIASRPMLEKPSDWGRFEELLSNNVRRK
jgi:hypothetical protein